MALNSKDGVTVPTHFHAGIPYDGLALAVDLASAIDHYHQGLPFTANGRLAASDAQAVDYYGSGAAPFDAAGRLAMANEAATSYLAGIGFSNTGRVTSSGLAPFLGVTITDQPDDWTGLEGANATFMVSAVSGDLSPLTYQWQEFTGTWNNLIDGGQIGGALTDTLTVSSSTLPDDGRVFRCVVSNDQGPAQSDAATMNVNSAETFYVITEAGDNVLTEVSDFVLNEAA